MNLFDRVKLATSIMLNRKAKKPDAPFVWPAWRGGKPQWHLGDFGAYIGEGFNLNALVYGAIMFKCRSITQAPLRAYTGDPDNPEALPFKHPLSQLLAQPNKYQSSVSFRQTCEVFLNLAGETFIMLWRPSPGKTPVAMYALRPDRVYILPDEAGGLAGYAYVPEGKAVTDGLPILPDDMMHIKLPNPGDPLEGMGHGLSPLSPMAQSADVDNMVTEFLKIFFERGAIPPFVLSFDVPLDENTINQIQARWKEKYGGLHNWTEVAVLDSAGKAQRLGMTFDELGFDAIDERNESRILGPFGVPPILIGTRVGLARSTYANYAEARRACWEDTLIPETRLFEAEYQAKLGGEEYTIAHDLSEVPALQRDIPALVTAAKMLWDMGTPRDLAFATVGLRIEETPGGAESYIPMGVIPSGAMGVQPPPAEIPPETEEAEEEPGKEKATLSGVPFRR